MHRALPVDFDPLHFPKDYNTVIFRLDGALAIFLSLDRGFSKRFPALFPFLSRKPVIDNEACRIGEHLISNEAVSNSSGTHELPVRIHAGLFIDAAYITANDISDLQLKAASKANAWNFRKYVLDGVDIPFNTGLNGFRSAETFAYPRRDAVPFIVPHGDDERGTQSGGCNDLHPAPAIPERLTGNERASMESRNSL